MVATKNINHTNIAINIQTLESMPNLYSKLVTETDYGSPLLLTVFPNKGK